MSNIFLIIISWSFETILFTFQCKFIFNIRLVTKFKRLINMTSRATCKDWPERKSDERSERRENTSEQAPPLAYAFHNILPGRAC